MEPILGFLLLLMAGPPSSDPWVEVRLTITRDPYTSSDQVTLCRVRAQNMGGRRWQGKSLAFEARSLGGDSAVRQRGRFGLELEPYGSLETLVALPGRHDRIEVVPLSGSAAAKPESKWKGARKKSRKHPR
jgi:hypothetical protein